MSVVIPTYNRLTSLIRLVKSLEVLKEFPEEVVIINDGSEDRTKEYLNQWEREKHDFIAITYNNQFSQGPGAARNIGIKLASSHLIGFTDDDCIVQKSWIKAIQNSKIWNNHRNIIGIGGKVLPFRKGIISEYFTFHSILEPPRPISYLVTANACYLKEGLIQVDGFNESYKYPGGEDCGLSLKLANKGYRFGYEKNMIIWHDYRTSLLSFFKTFYRYGRGCAEIVNKHYKNANYK